MVSDREKGMESFRRSAVIPIAVAIAGWVATGPFDVAAFHRLVCVISMVLLAVLAGLSVEKRGLTPSNIEKEGHRWNPRSFLLATGMIGLGVIALGSYIRGHIIAREKLQGNRNLSAATTANLTAKAHSLVGSEGPNALTQVPSDTSVPVTGGVSPKVRSVGTDDFVSRYVFTQVASRTGPPRWTFLISDQTRSVLPALDEAAREAISEAGYRNISLFRPSLIREGKLNELYGADPVLVRQLADFCDGVILVTAESNPIPDSGEQGLHTLEIVLRVRIISPPAGIVRKEFLILEHGAGFTLNEAAANAQQRAAKELKRQLKVIAS